MFLSIGELLQKDPHVILINKIKTFAFSVFSVKFDLKKYDEQTKTGISKYILMM